MKSSTDLDHNGFQFGTFDGPAEEQRLVDDAGGAGRLDARRMFEQGVDTVEIRVDHDGRTSAQINVLLPPIRHVIRRPPGVLKKDIVEKEIHKQPFRIRKEIIITFV